MTGRQPPSKRAQAIKAMRAGQIAKAVTLAKQHVRDHPGDINARHLLGVMLFQHGQPQEAARSIAEAIKGGSENPEYFANWGLALKAAGQLPEALDAYDSALEREPTRAGVWNDRGTVLTRLGRHAEAEQSFQQALALDGNDVKTCVNLSGTLLALGRLEDAVRVAEKAVHLNAGLAPAFNALGNALSRSGRTDEAIKTFERAVRLDSTYAEALANLASLYEETNRLEAARDAAARARDAEPDYPHANLVLAKCDRRAEQFQSGLDRLSSFSLETLPAPLARDIAFEQSRLFDRLDHPAEAFAAMEAGNRHALNAAGVDKSLGDQFLKTVATLSATTFSQPSRQSSSNDNRDPVFLVGFPRSGTTLLGQVLDAHSGLTMVEERPMLDQVIARLRHMPVRGGYPSGLADLNPDTITELRQVYIDAATRETRRATEQRVVDKFPLHLIHVGLIRTLFPESRLVLALRHPCDVVLSCFMQNFRPNPAMANFYSIQRAALTYDRVMGLWTHYQTTLNPDHHTIRYEDVVTDFQAEISRLLAYLDLPWEDGMRDYTERARSQGRIDTPSYHQVTEAIYTRSRYRWRRYAAALEPVMETLLPWIDGFGYAEDDPYTGWSLT